MKEKLRTSSFYLANAPSKSASHAKQPHITMKLGIMIFVFPDFSLFQNEQFPSWILFAYRMMGGQGSILLTILSQIKIEV